MKVYEGKLVSNGKKFGIVVSRFNVVLKMPLLDMELPMMIYP